MLSARARMPMVALAALSLSVSLPACAGATPGSSRAATRLVSAKLLKIAPLKRKVTCRKQGTRWRCAWTGERVAKGVRSRCRGTFVVRRVNERLRARSVSRRCRALPTPAPVFPYGFNDNGIHQRVITAAEDALLTSRIGASSSRIAFDWSGAEPTPGEHRFGVYDDYYRAMRARGVRPLFIFVYAPAWARNHTCPLLADCHAQPPTPDHYDDAGRMAALVAQRYPELAGIEVWNEANLKEFWGSGPDPTAYGELLKAVYRRVKQVAPKMPVISSGLGNGEPPGFMSPAQFLEGIYADGAGSSMDAIGIHPYPFSATSLDNTFKTLDAVRAVRAAHHDAARPIWVTEFGATTTGNQPPLTDQQQATLLVSAYRTLRAMPDVKAVFFHTLVEPPFGPGSADTGYGIVRADLSPKPAFCALAAEWGRSGACSQ
jgi:polysaccharide biosynthesis protein PslG